MQPPNAMNRQHADMRPTRKVAVKLGEHCRESTFYLFLLEQIENNTIQHQTR